MSAKLSNKPDPAYYSFDAIGTRWQLTFYSTVNKNRLATILQAVDRRIADFDQTYSRFRNDSLISAMGKSAGTYRLPSDAKPMLELYRSLYDITKGKFTPLIGQVLIDAGYDAHYSLKPKQLHKPPSWQSTINYDYPNLTLTQPAVLDFGAAGKGYLVDLIVRLIESYSVTDFCVNAGGDMYYSLVKVPAQQVGLEHPQHSDEVIGTATIKNLSICGSASNRRRWANFHHTIDPDLLASPEETQAIWVVTSTTMLADALATALCFINAAKLKQYYSFEYAVLHSDNSISYSPDFPGEFF